MQYNCTNDLPVESIQQCTIIMLYEEIYNGTLTIFNKKIANWCKFFRPNRKINSLVSQIQAKQPDVTFEFVEMILRLIPTENS